MTTPKNVCWFQTDREKHRSKSGSSRVGAFIKFQIFKKQQICILYHPIHSYYIIHLYHTCFIHPSYTVIYSPCWFLLTILLGSHRQNVESNDVWRNHGLKNGKITMDMERHMYSVYVYIYILYYIHIIYIYYLYIYILYTYIIVIIYIAEANRNSWFLRSPGKSPTEIHGTRDPKSLSPFFPFETGICSRWPPNLLWWIIANANRNWDCPNLL